MLETLHQSPQSKTSPAQNAAAYLKPFPECLHCRKRDLCWTFVLLKTSVWTLELSRAH